MSFLNTDGFLFDLNIEKVFLIRYEMYFTTEYKFNSDFYGFLEFTSSYNAVCEMGGCVVTV